MEYGYYNAWTIYGYGSVLLMTCSSVLLHGHCTDVARHLLPFTQKKTIRVFFLISHRSPVFSISFEVCLLLNRSTLSRAI